MSVKKDYNEHVRWFSKTKQKQRSFTSPVNNFPGESCAHSGYKTLRFESPWIDILRD